MALRNSISSFGTITKILHWTMVILIISLLTIGFLMKGMDNSPDKFKLYGLHKSFGITVLFLACIWTVWRISSIKPALPDTLSPFQKKGVSVTKYLLLTLLFAMPLTGWGISSAAGLPVSVFGGFVLPDFLSPDRQLSHNLGEVHENLALILIAIASFHALAALLHHFYFKDTVLRRMLPFGGTKKTGE